jgi:ElaB/YqjD/DUF883 family membrane-anchored ribosome-binding protein
MMNQGNDQSIAHQAADVVDHVADGIKSAAQGVGGSVRKASHAVRETAERAVDAVGSTYKEANQFARRSLNHSRTRARLWEKTFANSVRDNPKTSLLVAAALGAVVIAWWKRK